MKYLNCRLKLTFTLALIALLVPPVTAENNATMTRNNGTPVGNNRNSQTAGENGPTLLQDTHLIEKLAAFDRERIPERVVHARGVGVHGEFESFVDFSKYTMASPLQSKGKKTPTFVRFSTVINSKGSPETLRDPRGFAVRFYSDQGNWDIVGNNLPVFFIRDAIQFPDLIHSLKPSPITNLQDPSRWFDFLSNVPESTHMLTFLYSDRGTPASLRTMEGFGVSTFKMINTEGKSKYVKFIWHSRQGIKNFTAQEALIKGGENFNLHTQDLYKAIEDKNYPSWDLYVQLIDPADLNKFAFNPLDDTKIWPTDLVPEVLVGRLTLKKIPDNFFNNTERYAPSPSNMIPGIEASEDKMLQGRLFSYGDTQRYRLGVNHQQFPINQPNKEAKNFNQDGEGNYRKVSADVNYQPSGLKGSYQDNANYLSSKLSLAGTTVQIPIQKTLNFKQAGDLYRSFSEQDKANLISNLSGDLGQVENSEIKLTIVSYTYKADADYGMRLAKAVNVDLSKVKDRAAKLKE